MVQDYHFALSASLRRREESADESYPLALFKHWLMYYYWGTKEEAA